MFQAPLHHRSGFSSPWNRGLMYWWTWCLMIGMRKWHLIGWLFQFSFFNLPSTFCLKKKPPTKNPWIREDLHRKKPELVFFPGSHLKDWTSVTGFSKRKHWIFEGHKTGWKWFVEMIKNHTFRIRKRHWKKNSCLGHDPTFCRNKQVGTSPFQPF